MYLHHNDFYHFNIFLRELKLLIVVGSLSITFEFLVVNWQFKIYIVRLCLAEHMKLNGSTSTEMTQR